MIQATSARVSPVAAGEGVFSVANWLLLRGFEMDKNGLQEAIKSMMREMDSLIADRVNLAKADLEQQIERLEYQLHEADERIDRLEESVKHLTR